MQWRKKYHSVRKLSKSIIKIIERGKLETSCTQIHDHSHTCLSTETSRKSGGVKLVKNCLLSEMMEMTHMPTFKI